MSPLPQFGDVALGVLGCIASTSHARRDERTGWTVPTHFYSSLTAARPLMIANALAACCWAE